MGASEVSRILRGYDQLCDLVDSELALIAFADVAAELRVVSENVRSRGDFKTKHVTRRPDIRIPTRELAVKVMTIIDQIPGANDDDTNEERMQIAALLANIAVGFMHAIFVEYDDLASSDSDEESV